MSSEGVRISNPKGNNRDYLVSFIGSSGVHKKLRTLRPGQSLRSDKKHVVVEEVRRPARLTIEQDGTVSLDRRG